MFIWSVYILRQFHAIILMSCFIILSWRYFSWMRAKLVEYFALILTMVFLFLLWRYLQLLWVFDFLWASFLVFVSIFQLRNTFDEFLKDGTLNTINFSPEQYFQEYQRHLLRLTELSSSDIYGPLFKATLKLWTSIGRYGFSFLVSWSTHLHCSAAKNSKRGTVHGLKRDLKMLEMGNLLDQSTL